MSDGSRVVFDVENHPRQAGAARKLSGQHVPVNFFGISVAVVGGAQRMDQMARFDLDEGDEVDGRVAAQGAENADGTGTHCDFAGTTARHVGKSGSTLVRYCAKNGSKKARASKDVFKSQSEIHSLHVWIDTFPFNVTVSRQTMLWRDLAIHNPLRGPGPMHASPIKYFIHQAAFVTRRK